MALSPLAAAKVILDHHGTAVSSKHRFRTLLCALPSTVATVNSLDQSATPVRLPLPAVHFPRKFHSVNVSLHRIYKRSRLSVAIVADRLPRVLPASPASKAQLHLFCNKHVAQLDDTDQLLPLFPPTAAAIFRLNHSGVHSKLALPLCNLLPQSSDPFPTEPAPD